VGEECCCPSCGSKFIKTSYNQVFCKVKGGTICKDGYWNFVIGSKRNNTTRISPANSAYYEKYIAPRIIEDDGLDYLLERG
jgi:nucleoside-specific outer membrane channel protein Tsx